jgi:HlyD family secretion protein
LLRILQKSEAIVPEGTPLVEVGDPANIEVVIDLLSREAVKVAPGARVIVSRWGGGDDLDGAVRLVEPFGTLKVSALGIEEQRVNVIIDFKEPTDRIARLGHGYQVDATIVLWERTKVLRVPIGALFRSGGRWHVFAVDADRASLTPIEIGHINDEHAEVLKGLAAGTRVIVNPGEAVADGVRIRQRRSTGGAG